MNAQGLCHAVFQRLRRLKLVSQAALPGQKKAHENVTLRALSIVGGGFGNLLMNSKGGFPNLRVCQIRPFVLFAFGAASGVRPLKARDQQGGATAEANCLVEGPSPALAGGMGPVSHCPRKLERIPLLCPSLGISASKPRDFCGPLAICPHPSSEGGEKTGAKKAPWTWGILCRVHPVRPQKPPTSFPCLFPPASSF